MSTTTAYCARHRPLLQHGNTLWKRYCRSVGSFVPALPHARPLQMISHPPTRSLLAACHVYVSEGRNHALLQDLWSTVTAVPNSLLANVFVDTPYHRSNFTLLSQTPTGLASAAVTLAHAALQAVDLRTHEASHPRLGAVDHISCHPLVPGPAGMALAVQAARSIAQQLGTGAAAVPVFLYGEAHPQHAALADVRRALGYFADAKTGQWAGALEAPGTLPIAPSFGPAVPADASGVCCVGAVPWVLNYNILLDTHDMAAAKQAARAVSQRAGGLPSVQAMALQHAEGVEVACNLLDVERVPPEAVEAAVGEAAAAVGVGVVRSYRIGKSPQQLEEMLRGKAAPALLPSIVS